MDTNSENRMIVEKRKCIFIHIPKTGGTSIEYFFKKKGGQRKHALPRKIKKEFPSKWENYYKFAFVRNPWDRFVSLWVKFKEEVKLQENFNMLYGLNIDHDFNYYI